MIDTGIAAGCLCEDIKDVWKQDAQEIKVRRWIAQGGGESYERFWGEKYGG